MITGKNLERLAKPFFDQGKEKVFVSVHCSRVYIGMVPAQICRVCKNKPDVIEISKGQSFEELVRKLKVG